MLAPLFATAVVVAANPSAARQPAAPQCYDTLIRGKLVRQTPTIVPQCDDCIVMSWPYIDVLDVTRVEQGHAPLGQLTVLSVQHTWIRPPKDDRWWLRRNTAGGYNVISEGRHTPRCLKDGPRPQPFVELRPGQTLDDLEREGDQRYGHMAGGRTYYPVPDAGAKP